MTTTELLKEIGLLVFVASGGECEGCEEDECPSECGYLIEKDGRRLDPQRAKNILKRIVDGIGIAGIVRKDAGYKFCAYEDCDDTELVYCAGCFADEAEKAGKVPALEARIAELEKKCAKLESENLEFILGDDDD